MKIEVHDEYNPEKEIVVHPMREISNNLRNADAMLRITNTLNPEIIKEYVLVLERMLADEISDYIVDFPISKIRELKDTYSVLKEYDRLIDLIILYVSKQIALPINYNFENDEFMTTCLNYVKAGRRIRYHRVKAFIEVLGVNKGTELWKEIIATRHIELRNTNKEIFEKQKEQTAAEDSRLQIEAWTKLGLADFALAILDEHRVLYRFDKCLIHDAFRDFDDPDVAYLASCYNADSSEFNIGKYRHVRRTQTLHHAPFCDEFYWDIDYHTSPKQPPIELTEKLGKEDSEKLREEYSNLL